MTGADGKNLTRAERIFIRISVLQTVLAVVGIFTGAVALYAALVEADAVRKQQEASVWPSLATGSTFWSKAAVARNGGFGDREGPLFQVTVLNSGIGPARIRSVRFSVDGVPYREWRPALEKLTGSDGIEIGMNSVSGRVIQSGERIDMITLLGEPAQLVRDSVIDTAGRSARALLEICYCSVFDACWQVSNAPELTNAEPLRVKKCPDYGDEQFLN